MINALGTGSVALKPDTIAVPQKTPAQRQRDILALFAYDRTPALTLNCNDNVDHPASLSSCDNQ